MLTTDFSYSSRGNEIKYLARTIKPSSELENERIIEKFEIEREYWERKGLIGDCNRKGYPNHYN